MKRIVLLLTLFLIVVAIMVSTAPLAGWGKAGDCAPTPAPALILLQDEPAVIGGACYADNADPRSFKHVIDADAPPGESLCIEAEECFDEEG
jgi:hypothetical protein